jgi:hypothetical protein
MTPLAPDLFSMMIVLPRSSTSFAANRRATKSTAPPAGNGRIKWIGFSGYSAKLWTGATSRTKAAMSAVGRVRVRFMVCLFRSLAIEIEL